MKRSIIRSIIYNIFFYGLTAVACFVCLPALILPRKVAMGVVTGFVSINIFLERYLLNLRFEIRGRENVPTEGSYIIAAKHQSAYETFKLHALFNDPAVILKKELLSIPLWGQYLKKTDVIAIDRSSRETASKSIQDGALRMMAQGRPIVIFPQGTRVAIDATTAEKPYKLGVARMQEATGLPIIPLAMNSGYFWPRNGFWKSSGTVVFEFLKPIPAGMERGTLMAKLESEIEGASLKLLREAREKDAQKKSGGVCALAFLGFATLLFGAYSIYWFEVSKRVMEAGIAELHKIYGDEISFSDPVISGYPGRMVLRSDSVLIENSVNMLGIDALELKSWPFPGMKIDIHAQGLRYRDVQWPEALSFQSLEGLVSIEGELLHVHESALVDEGFVGSVKGTFDFAQKPFPKLDIVLSMLNGEIFLNDLATLGLLEPRSAMFLASGMQALKDPETGVVSLPIHQKSETLMAGPFPVMRLPIYDVSAPPKRLRPVIPSQVSPTSQPASAQGSDSLPAPAP